MKKLLLLISCAFSVLLLSDWSYGTTTVGVQAGLVDGFDVSRANEEAVKVLDAAQLDNNFNVHYIRGVLYRAQSNDKKAIEELLEAIKMKADHYQSYLLLGQIYISGKYKDISKAAEYFGIARKVAPKEPVVYTESALLYVYTKDMLNAIALLEEGIGKTDAESLYYNQTIVLMSSDDSVTKKFDFNKNGRIIRNLERAIELSPKTPYYFLLGAVYLEENAYDKAEKAFNSVLKQEPKYVLAILGLASVYEGRHEYEKAIGLAKEALKIDPGNKAAQSELKEYEEGFEKWKREKKN
ncbi:MAG: tetratricopeptide repeat protein [Deltaproteobacteria bacterium]|nr:tetratricopeptide repeat protein [Deltaproteobacteria bacterium]